MIVQLKAFDKANVLLDDCKLSIELLYVGKTKQRVTLSQIYPSPTAKTELKLVVPTDPEYFYY